MQDGASLSLQGHSTGYRPQNLWQLRRPTEEEGDAQRVHYPADRSAQSLLAQRGLLLALTSFLLLAVRNTRSIAI